MIISYIWTVTDITPISAKLLVLADNSLFSKFFTISYSPNTHPGSNKIILACFYFHNEGLLLFHYVSFSSSELISTNA